MLGKIQTFACNECQSIDRDGNIYISVGMVSKNLVHIENMGLFGDVLTTP